MSFCVKFIIIVTKYAIIYCSCSNLGGLKYMNKVLNKILAIMLILSFVMPQGLIVYMQMKLIIFHQSHQRGIIINRVLHIKNRKNMIQQLYNLKKLYQHYQIRHNYLDTQQSVMNILDNIKRQLIITIKKQIY